MCYALLEQPVGQFALLTVGKGLIFLSPMHAGNNGIRLACLGTLDILQDGILINIVYDIGRGSLDAIGAVSIVEQGNAKAVSVDE